MNNCVGLVYTNLC